MADNLVQGALFTVMVVRAGMLHDPAFTHELAQQVERSPRFFLQAPVVLDLKGADGFTAEADFVGAGETLREHTLALIGVQNAAPAQLAAAAAAGLASFAPNATQPARPRAARPVAASPTPAPQAAPPPPRAAARLVTTPVRSGTQIYARGTRRQHPRLRPTARPRARRGERRHRSANLLLAARSRAGQHRRALSG
jgi:septum site-determining protein MinC